MKLLVSARDAAEAVTAVNSGVAVVDVKNPLRGALGPPNPLVARQVVAAVRGRAPLSLAMGELVHYRSSPLDYLAGYTWAKAGLSDFNGGGHMHRWLAWANEVATTRCQPAMVAYADWRECDAPDPLWLAALTTEWGVQAFLIDTFEKEGFSLLDHVSIEYLAELTTGLKANGTIVALAGSLDAAAIGQLSRLPADLIAVRGAACRSGDRNEPLDAGRIERLNQLVSAGAVNECGDEALFLQNAERR